MLDVAVRCPILLDDLRDYTGSYRLAPLSECEAKPLRHGHGVHEVDRESGVISRHNLSDERDSVMKNLNSGVDNYSGTRKPIKRKSQRAIS